jgi:hypothetical protein
VPKHCAEAVGRSTKLPQNEKKMAQIHTAYRACTKKNVLINRALEFFSVIFLYKFKT